jgi:hypothetical protein
VNPATVYMALGRLVKTGQILHVGHEYLVAPLPEVEVADEAEVMTPADVQVDLDVPYAEYAAAVAAGMFDGDPEPESVEEEILPPPDAPAPRVQATEPSWLDVTGAELDAMDAIPVGKPRHFIAAQLKREAKEKKLARGYASRFAPTAANIEMRRLLVMNLPPYDPSDPF